jgi:hypothetical protein
MTLRTAAGLAALAMALGLSAQGLAQTAPGPRTPNAEQTLPPKTPIGGQILVQDANTILARQDLIGQTVYAPDDAKIGSISDLIVGKDGKTVQGFVIGVGGFLGIGAKDVALQIDKLRITAAADGSVRLTMDVKREELANAPTFQSKRDQDAEKLAEKRRNEAPAQRPMPSAPRN